MNSERLDKKAKAKSWGLKGVTTFILMAAVLLLAKLPAPRLGLNSPATPGLHGSPPGSLGSSLFSAPSTRRSSVGVMGGRLTNYIPETEGQREWVFPLLPLPYASSPGRDQWFCRW